MTRSGQGVAQLRHDDLILEPVEDLGRARDMWNGLAAQTGNVFMTWEWADAWVRHLGESDDLDITVARQADGIPRVLLPLYFARRRPGRLLRFIGAGPGDELGPICAEQDSEIAARLLRSRADALLEETGVLLAERMRGDSALVNLIGGRELRRASTPVVPIEGRSFEEWLDSKSRNFRSQVRRTERRLMREHRVTYRLTDSEESLERDLHKLMELHRKRWEHGNSTAFEGAREAFHRDFASRALKSGWLRLWTMELDGEPAASWYGLRYGGAEYYYQAGRDPRFAADKIGFVLLCHTIRSACEDGVREYRFGLGQESYKSRFTEIDPGLVTIALGRGARGRAAVRAVRGALTMRDRARQLRARRGRSRPRDEQ